MRPDRRQLLLFSSKPPPRFPPLEQAARDKIAGDEKHRALQELARWWRSRR